MRRLAAIGILAALLGGCVYYNGMYNTKRLAGSARRAERDGRPFEANNLWGQVITRADSLVTRHPDSKYVDEAMVLKGLALARLNQCPSAVGPLGRAASLELEADVAEEAALALGRCRMELGDPGAAAFALAPVTESEDPVRRREARVQSARALRMTGRPAEALAILDGVADPRVSHERLLALAAAGQDDEALRIADSLLALNDTTRGWDSVLGAVGRANPRVASGLVDRLGARGDVVPALQARRLFEDADRLEPTDSVRAAARLREAARIGAGFEPGARAALRLFRLRLSQVASVAELAPLLDTLRRAGDDGPVAGEVQSLAATMTTVSHAADSSGPDVPQGDLRLFLAAESARDSLRAPLLAASLFRRLVDTWPQSPYAPKAVLAGQSLDPAWADAARALLDERYASSPYVAFIRGQEPFGYRELEDSLQTYALSLAASQVRRRPPPTRGGRRLDDPDPVQPDRERPRPPGQQPRPRVPPRELEP